MQPVTMLRAALVGLGVGGAALTWTAPGAPLQTEETNTRGVVAELTECRRSEGVLSLKVRLRNTADEASSLIQLVNDPKDYDAYYVIAAGKKYFVLRDSDKVPLASAPNSGKDVWVTLPKGASFLWWGKYPAPPPDVKKITYVTHFGAVFDSVPISDQ